MRVLAMSFVGTMAVVAGSASADFQTFSGEWNSTRPLFEAAAGGVVPTENFEGFAGGAVVGEMPGINAQFAPEDANGDSFPLPVVVTNSSVTGPNWIANFGNGRPAWSPWVVRPMNDEKIYALGAACAQGDYFRIEAFDAGGTSLGTVDSPAITVGFAGFTSTTPVDRVVITPLGNFDGLNGMDNLQVSIVPIPTPAGGAVIALGAAGLAVRRRR